MRLGRLITAIATALVIGSLGLAYGRDKDKDGVPDGPPKKPPKQEKVERPKKKPHPEQDKKKDKPKAEGKKEGKKKDADNKGEKKKQAASEPRKDAAAKPAKKAAAKAPAAKPPAATPAKSAAAAPDEAAATDKSGKHQKKHKGPATASATAGPFSSRRDIDWREAHQKKRIQFGIRSGALTKDEAASLQKREKDIHALEASFRSDGHLSAAERKQLHTKLDDASRMIFAGKHDTDGWQMPALRFGKNVFAKSDFLKKLESEHLPAAESRTMTVDFRRALALHRRLGQDGLTPEQRAQMQAEYSDVLYKYFEVRTP